LLLCLHRCALAAFACLLLHLPAQAGETTPLLYEIRSDTATVYLFGTIHVGTRSMYPLNTVAQAAFDEADVLALEADPTDQASIMAAMAQALYTAPDTLERHIAPDLYQRVKTMLPASGIPLNYARRLRPHLLAMVLSMTEVQRLGYDPALGLDFHFASRATTAGKPIVQLESMAEQMALFNALPAETQEGMLRTTLDVIAQGRTQDELDELVAAWSKGDADAIMAAVLHEFEQLDERSAQALHTRLYDERNRAMADKVEAMLHGAKTHFVAIGAGHLVGSTGVTNLLARKGYTVRRR
jgi:uncharacterized protein YbaP (TraB family)